MGVDPRNPLIVQSDRTLLLEVHSARFEEARGAIAPFADLEKSPEHIHTYRLSPLSLWNAAAAGLGADEIIARLRRFSKYPVPQSIEADVRELVGRWGRLRLERIGGDLLLTSSDGPLLAELARNREVAIWLGPRRSPTQYAVPDGYRGLIKQALVAAGWPAEDLAGYTEGAALAIDLRLDHFRVREYQRLAADAFFASGHVRGGSGVIVLPPGSGKTIVGMVAMALVGQSTLILTTSRTSVAQWIRELADKTSLPADQVAEYAPGNKRVAPVTLATYQMLTWRPERTDEFPNMVVFQQRDWGLIIYDEVHLLPAPVFRATAQIQARRRLGLTATLVREDGRETDVFSLIGPKRYDVPWRDLERQGWIAEASCTEVRLALPPELRMVYATAEQRDKHRIAAENPHKLRLLKAILRTHAGVPTLVIGQYLDQLGQVAAALEAPLITGKTPQVERERLFGAFRRGELALLVLSRVGNFALDLPDAALLVQVSGTFGSRQEEAQRLGRVLRPKADSRSAHFYTLVTRDTSELDFAHNRQLFLAEQGYSYRIMDESDFVE